MHYIFDNETEAKI